MEVAEAEALLGLPVASPEEEIKKAYKKAALKAHPDKGGSSERFQRLAEAYARLLEAKTPRLDAPDGADAGVDAAAVFASVYTWDAQHGITRTVLDAIHRRVEFSAAELRGALEHPSFAAYVVVDARRPDEVAASGAWPGRVTLSEGARDKTDVVRLPVTSCVDDAGAVIFDARTGPTPASSARLDAAARAALGRVAAAARAGQRVVVSVETNHWFRPDSSSSLKTRYFRLVLGPVIISTRDLEVWPIPLAKSVHIRPC